MVATTSSSKSNNSKDLWMMSYEVSKGALLCGYDEGYPSSICQRISMWDEGCEDMNAWIETRIAVLECQEVLEVERAVQSV